MKSLIRSLATAGLIGTTLLGSWLSQSAKLLALPTEVIVEKLKPIPVFTVADSQGAPLVASGENNAKVAGVFISQQDAQKFVQDLQQNNPELGKQVQVVPVSLAEIFELAQANQNKPDAINFAYVPIRSEVEEAKKLLSQSNQEYEGGVPLFVAKAGPERGYLTIKQKENEVIPFFFEEDQVQKLVERFKQEQPDFASSITVEVVFLEVVLATLQQGNDEMLKKIVIWPSTESIDFLRSASQSQQK
jgi:hypothetical protein